jgi:ribA/ribD-fused uncharacterized protein
MDILEFQGMYRWLSNFWTAPIQFIHVGRAWIAPTVEHAFQACKTTDADRIAWVLSASTPGEAKRRGRQLKLRANWDSIKMDVMEAMLRLKFSMPELRAKLLATDGRLVEGNKWNDVFWGVCNGHGENHLGRLLMKIREEARCAPG